jgi:outer membrane protein TolC
MIPLLNAQDPPPAALSLSLSTAVELALKNNIQTLVAGQQVIESEGARGISLSALLPNLAASSSQTNMTINLAAMGLPVKDLNGFPAFVGPFNRFDARLSLVQSLFDLGAIRRFQSNSRGVELVRDQQDLAVQQVTTASIISYLTVLEAEQSLSAARANVQLAERLLELATSQKDAGVATGIDVARAETRAANQRVQLAQAQTSLDTARLNLLRVIGLPLSTNIVLADRMRFEPERVLDSNQAIERALSDRVEIKIAELQVQIAETQRKAAVAGWLPTLSAFGDYGSSGLKPNELNLPTRSAGVQLNLPVFDGGHTRSEVKVASSRLVQAEMQRNDLRAAVEKEVRQALMNLKTLEEQVKASIQAEVLATRELELAQDRFKNGVGDNIEVVNAQTALENARQTYVSSLTQFNVARVNLAVAVGHPEDFRF